MRRVAITGLGAVSAAGVGVGVFWDRLVAGRSGIRAITSFDASTLAAPIAGEVPDYAPEPYFPTIKIELLDRTTQFAMIAAEAAIADAALTLSEDERPRAGTYIGTGLACTTTDAEQYERFFGQRITRLHPFTIPRMMINAPAAQISMRHGLQGPALCVSTACAAATHAIGEAAEIIRSGRADVVIAGGADAPLSLPILKAWEAMRVMAPPFDGDPAKACRPFSLDRRGLVIAEGAGVVVLESWDHATARGATIHAELAGYGATADAGHLTQPGVAAPARAIEIALARANLNPGDIQYVNAHGTGTRANDTTETTVLKQVFGSHAGRLAISATKSMHGHVMGASGGLELIATILAIERGVVPPTINYVTPDPQCDLDYVPNDARELHVDAAISNSFAFGGLNAVIAVRRATL